jgi:hypothetical protein
MKTKEVFVAVEVPIGDLCYSLERDIHCTFFNAEYHLCRLKFDVFENKDNYDCLKSEQCKSLSEYKRICLNCGYSNVNYCELYSKKVSIEDTCTKFVYGSWK